MRGNISAKSSHADVDLLGVRLDGAPMRPVHSKKCEHKWSQNILTESKTCATGAPSRPTPIASHIWFFLPLKKTIGVFGMHASIRHDMHLRLLHRPAATWPAARSAAAALVVAASVADAVVAAAPSAAAALVVA